MTKAEAVFDRMRNETGCQIGVSVLGTGVNATADCGERPTVGSITFNQMGGGTIRACAKHFAEWNEEPTVVWTCHHDEG